MMLADSRNVIAAAIKAALPSLKTSEPHGGRFTAEELKRWSVVSPACLVSIATVGNPVQQTGVTSPVSFVIFVITKDTAEVKRDAAAVNIVHGINKIMPGQYWGDDMFVSEPEKVISKNLYSTGIDKTGVAIWAIEFFQTVNLGDKDDLSELDDFLEFAGKAMDVNDDTHILIETTGALPGQEEPESPEEP